jgi:hypothetical protein
MEERDRIRKKIIDYFTGKVIRGFHIRKLKWKDDVLLLFLTTNHHKDEWSADGVLTRNLMKDIKHTTLIYFGYTNYSYHVADLIDRVIKDDKHHYHAHHRHNRNFQLYKHKR